MLRLAEDMRSVGLLPNQVPAFAALYESGDFSICITLEDFAYARLTGDKEDIAELRIPFDRRSALPLSYETVAIAVQYVDEIACCVSTCIDV